jgi:hypothetical protein
LATASAPDALLPSIDDTVDASLVGVEDVDSQLSDEMIARPLFWVSRRPVSVSIPTKVSPVVTSGKLKDIKLLGLFGVGDGAGIIAAIGGDKQRLSVGDKVKGWTLDTVERNEVVFSNGAQREKLQLKQQVFVVPAASGAGTGSGQATSGNKPSGKDVRPPSLGFGG